MKAVVLAAGKSTRMKSERTKMAHCILGRPILHYLLDSIRSLGVQDEDIILVVGDNEDEIRALAGTRVRYAIQKPQLGTAHALLAAADQIATYSGELLVTVGDNPFITAAALQRLHDHHRRRQAACTLISAIFPQAPPPYGRIIRDAVAQVAAVVEEIDATPEQRQIREVNASIYLFDNAICFPLLQRIGNHNAKGEYYLTDIVGLLNQAKQRVEASIADDFRISIGINNRWELQQAQEEINQARLRQMAIEAGVTILQPASVTIEYDVEIGPDTIIYPNTYLAAGTRIGRDCRIGPGVHLSGQTIAAGSVITAKD